MKKIFSFCNRYLLKHKWRLFFYITLCVIISASSLLSPYIIGDFIDNLMREDDISFIFRYFALFAGINVSSLLLGYVSGRLYVKLQTRLGYTFNRDFIRKLQHAPLSFTSKQDSAYLNQRINNDVNALIIFCIGIIQSILVNTVLVAVSLILIFSFHPILATILLGIAAIYFTFYALYKKVLYRASHAYQESQSKFFAKLNEQLFNIRFIKLHSLFEHFISRLNHSFEILLGNALKYQQANYIYGGLDKLVMVAAQLVLLLFGGMEIVSGRLTIGRFIIISSYFNMMLGAIRYFFGLGQTVLSNMVSYNRLQELAIVSQEPNGEHQLDEVCSVELKSISFAYGEAPVLRDVSITLTKGHIYILLGPNGAGKSTLVDVLLGLQNGNYTGQVLYNGLDIDHVDMYNVRNKHIGVSEQESILLADTLAYNISLEHPDVTETKKEMIDSLVGILGLDTYISALPNGLGTIINEGAANVSGGEKQKLSILRAILKNPDVLVLDEPTSALDIESKAALKTYLNEIKKDKIIVIITHDKELVNRDTDMILTLGRFS